MKRFANEKFVGFFHFRLKRSNAEQTINPATHISYHKMMLSFAILTFVGLFLHLTHCAFVVGPTDELFAIIGKDACAADLPFGPVAITTSGTVDGKYEHFLSTNTPNKNVLHTGWTQIVTSDGDTELFRIYWTFSTPRTLNDHFYYAVNFGESVSYRVVEAGGQEHFYNGKWWFSEEAGISRNAFDITYVGKSFSARAGYWGAFNGEIKLHTYAYLQSDFWGVSNYYQSDQNCMYVKRGVGQEQWVGENKVYMYMTGVAAPTQAPTMAPSRPTVAPTAMATVPSAEPTALPTMNVPSDAQLFAVVGGSSCAENLYYGPQAITASGSADGQNEYFLSTLIGREAHSQWLQIVIDEGVELFRIYWTFDESPKSLGERFENAVKNGERVLYRIVVAATGKTLHRKGFWYFSNGAGITTSTFEVTNTTCCFSRRDGAWGGAAGIINGGLSDWPFFISDTFWGVGNFYSHDNFECGKVYQNSVVMPNTKNPKTYMYIDSSPSPTMRPTLNPATSLVVDVQQPIFGATFREYTDNKAAFEKVLTMAIAAGAELNTEDVYHLVAINARIANPSSGKELRLKEDSLVGAVDANYLRSSADRFDTLSANPDDHVAFTYSIIIEQSRGLTNREIGRRVSQSVNSGQFAVLLRAFAVQENVPELTSATSPGVYIEGGPFVDYGDGADEKEAVLTVPTIIGIAVGGFALIVLMLVCCLTRCSVMFALYRCVCPCNQSVEPQEPMQATTPPEPLEEPEDVLKTMPTKSEVSAPPLPFEMYPLHTSAPPQRLELFKPVSVTPEDSIPPPQVDNFKPGPPQKFDVFKSMPTKSSGASADADINSYFYGASASSTSHANNSYQGLCGSSTAHRTPDVSKPEEAPVPAVAVPVSGREVDGYTDLAVVEAYDEEV